MEDPQVKKNDDSTMSSLRQRGSINESKETTFGDDDEESLLLRDKGNSSNESQFNGFKEQFKSFETKYSNKLIPFLIQINKLLATIVPYCNATYSWFLKMSVRLEPYHVKELTQFFIGFIYCFFGGYFVMLIAAIEAFRVCGWDRTQKCLNDLYIDFQKLKELNDNDNIKDENNDGIVDVEQISQKELAMRKIRLFFLTCDPEQVTGALAGLSSACIGVIAALKVKFAQSLTLGASIGNLLRSPVEKMIGPTLKQLVVEDYHKWIGPCINYGCKIFAISIAWLLSRIISAMYSSIRGGLMMSRGLIHYLSHMGFITRINHEETNLDEIVGAAFAFIGFYSQLSHAFTLPFPLNIILFPFSFLEWFLIWMIAG